MDRYIFLFLTLLSMSIALPVHAHQVKSDKGVTVLLHVDPSDEPISGTTTRMYFHFKNKEYIALERCHCIAYIAPYSQVDAIKDVGTKFDFATQTEKVMGSHSITHIFPRHDIYAVVLEGAPTNGASFSPFRLVYDLRVASGDEIPVEYVSSHRREWTEMSELLLLVVALVVFVAILIGKRYYKK